MLFASLFFSFPSRSFAQECKMVRGKQQWIVLYKKKGFVRTFYPAYVWMKNQWYLTTDHVQLLPGLGQPTRLSFFSPQAATMINMTRYRRKRCRSLFTTRLMIKKAIIYLTPFRSGEEIQEEEREEESYIVCYIGWKKKPLVPLLATDLEGMLGKTVMDKLLMVPVHKPNQLDLLQALNLDLHL